jgi:hypothetical protein
MKKVSMKGFNFKAFLVNHAEKLVFGLFALIALAALAGTDWARFAMTPEQVVYDAKKARDKILQTPWPADKKDGFVLQDYMDRASQLRAPLDFSKYEYSTNMWWPLYRKQELAKEPELFAVQDLTAKAGMMILGVADQSELPLDGDPGDTESMDPAAPTEPEEPEDEFAAGPVPTRQQPGAFAGGPGAMPGAMPGAAHAGALAGTGLPGLPGMPGGGMGARAGRRPVGGPGAMNMGAHDAGEEDGPRLMVGMAPGMEGMMPGMGGMMGGQAAAGVPSFPGIKPRGERFVAVRGVWPVHQQLDKLKQALNLQSRRAAEALLEITDFVLERQTAVEGDDPWSGPWEQVELGRAQEILEQAADYDLDELDPQIMHPVITSPLPMRLPKPIWGELATHPRIKNFQLTGEALERERRLQQKLVEEYEKHQAQISAKAKPAPRGFATQQRDFRGMAQNLMSSQMGDAAFREMDSYMRKDARGNQMAPPSELRSRLTAVGYLWLFRYFDFDIRPGYAYRYRVQLKIRNPNFGRPVEQVVDRAVTINEELTTPMSNVSEAAVVPRSVHYFVKDAERNLVAEANRNSRPLAEVSFFEWSPEYGTHISDTLRLKSYGQFVGEAQKETLLLNVAEPSLKTTKVDFESDDVFLDTLPDFRIPGAALANHPELQLPNSNRGKLGIGAELLVVDATGQLKLTDLAGTTPDEKRLVARVESERKNYKDLENVEAPTMNPLDAAAMGGMADMEEMMEGMMPGRRGGRGSNPRRPGAGGGPSGAHAGGAGGGPMMPGMMMPGMPGGGASGPGGRPSRGGPGGRR